MSNWIATVAWTMLGMPEFRHVHRRAQRLLLRRSGIARTLVASATLATIGGWILGSIVGFVVSLLFDVLPIEEVCILCSLGLLIVFYRMNLEGIRSRMLREIAGGRLPTCLRCGYDLRGLDGDRCPECGHSRTTA